MKKKKKADLPFQPPVEVGSLILWPDRFAVYNGQGWKEPGYNESCNYSTRSTMHNTDQIYRGTYIPSFNYDLIDKSNNAMLVLGYGFDLVKENTSDRAATCYREYRIDLHWIASSKNIHYRFPKAVRQPGVGLKQYFSHNAEWLKSLVVTSEN